MSWSISSRNEVLKQQAATELQQKTAALHQAIKDAKQEAASPTASLDSLRAAHNRISALEYEMHDAFDRWSNL